MLPRTYAGEVCSVARTLELIGDRWTLLVVRDAFLGVKRFDDFQAHLGVSRNVLADRLGRLLDDGILERHRYQERPERFEYRLGEKGLDLWPTVISLLKWGDKHLAGEHGPPRLVVHRDCGGEVTERLDCDRCGRRLGPRDVESRRGPGMDAAGVPAATL